LTPKIEERVYDVIGRKCMELGGWAAAVNGMPDHVHVVLSVPPKVSPSEVARNLKGISAHFIQSELSVPFEWQRGYGVFTFSKRGLDAAVDDVQQQKQHHRDGTTKAAIEYSTDEDDLAVRPMPAGAHRLK
jgi:REP element-mobilizing transposase RayT